MAGRASDLIFEVTHDELDGYYTAAALGFGITTQGRTLEELRANVCEVVNVHFDSSMEMPETIRLHFVREEVFNL